MNFCFTPDMGFRRFFNHIHTSYEQLSTASTMTTKKIKEIPQGPNFYPTSTVGAAIAVPEAIVYD
jgi:hypothetical protein